MSYPLPSMVLILATRKQGPRFGCPSIHGWHRWHVRGTPCFYRESGDLFMLCLFIIPVPRKINRTCSAAQSGQSRSPGRRGEGWWSREFTFSVWEQNSYGQKSGISLDVRCAWQCVVLCAVIGCNRVIWSVPESADRYARSRLRGR